MRRKASMRTRAVRTAAYIGLGAFVVLWLFPIIWLYLSSFRDPSDVFYNQTLPRQLTLANFARILANPLMVSAFRNSFAVATAAAVFDLVIAGMAAYGFARFRFSGRGVLQVSLLVIRLFPGVLLSVPLFQLAGKLHVYDTLIPLVLVNALFNLPFATWNLRSIVENIPVELEEASWLDGLSRIGGIFRIVLPLMAPGLAATGAFVFLLSWNEFLFATSFIITPEKSLITTYIAAHIGQYNIDYTGLMASGMLASLPMLLVFFLIQRYIVSGLTAGALRG